MNFYEHNRKNERFPLFLKFRNTCYTLFLLFSNITFCIDLFTFKIYTFSLEESLHKIVDCCEMINDETSKHAFRSTRDIFLTDSTIKDCEEDKISTLNIQHLWSRNFLCTQTHIHTYFSMSRLIQLTEESWRFLRRSRYFRQALFFRSFWPPSLIRMTVDT